MQIIRGKRPQRAIQIPAVLLYFIILAAGVATAQPSYTTWREYKGSSDSSNYSALKQINRSNVNKLEVAWTYPTGDKVEYPYSPIVIDRVIYVLAKNGAITAIDAASGKEIWSHPSPQGGGPHRGLNYWENKDRSDRRILVPWNDYLNALDARTGEPIESFGDHGRVDLKQGLRRDPKTIRIQSASPGRVFENLIILGSSPGEGYLAAPGDIRAFDVRSGNLVWQFHTIPHPGEFGYETWPKDAWKYVGAANDWGDMSLDEKRGIVYVPTGSPTYDFYGGDRKGDNLFGNCLLALDARTGKRLWHFQTVHHDLWDYDNVSAPELLTVRHGGELVDAVAQAGKTGFLYVFDRVTGKPLWPIEERPVPKSDVPGEFASPTQPFPTQPLPFVRQKYTVEDINPYFLTAEERAKWRDFMLSGRNEGMFTPPSLTRFTINMPGHSGGSGLFSTSADPATGTMYVVSFDGPAVLKLEPTESATRNNDWHGPMVSNIRGYEQITRVEPGSPPSENGDRGRVAAGAVQQGRTVYEQNCQTCHGTTLSGGGGGAPSLQNVIERLDEKEIRATVRQGQGQMPSFATIPDASLDALLAYLKNPEVAADQPRMFGNQIELSYPEGVEVPAQRYYSGWGFAPAMIGPPWSNLTAYDLNTGTIKWQVPYGEAIGLGPSGNNFGILQFHGPKAGVAVTAGGLLFSATTEHKIRAYDKDTGKVLWSAALPDRSQGSPAVYEVDGREYVVVGSRGAYIAFALSKDNVDSKK